MPRSQVAAVSHYDVNAPHAPTAAGKVPVLVLRERYGRGGKVTLHIEPKSQFGGHDEEAESDVEVSVEVSPDGVTFAATTAANNLTAVTDVTIGRLQARDFVVALRRGTDAYVRVTARAVQFKASRLGIDVRGNEDLELVQEGQDLRTKGPIG